MSDEELDFVAELFIASKMCEEGWTFDQFVTAYQNSLREIA